jgi:hypothetical protein
MLFILQNIYRITMVAAAAGMFGAWGWRPQRMHVARIPPVAFLLLLLLALM